MTEATTPKGFWSQRWLVVDTETTGPDPSSDRVVELGFVPFHLGEPGPRYGRLLNPGRPIDPAAIQVHGITDADVADCPPLADVAAGFLEHVAEADVIVGYNVLGFDAPLLEAELGDAWRDAVADKLFVDPLVLVRLDQVGRYWKGPGRHKLTSVASRLGVQVPGKAHRATADCLLAGQVLWRLREFSAVLGLPSEPDEFRRVQQSFRDQQEADFAAWKAKQPQR